MDIALASQRTQAGQFRTADALPDRKWPHYAAGTADSQLIAVIAMSQPWRGALEGHFSSYVIFG